MSKRGVPEETLRAQSTHFRYAQLSHHRPSFDLQATLLRGLKLPPDTLMPKEDLIISNQRLTQLEFSFGPKDQYDRLIPALESLTLLQHVLQQTCPYQITGLEGCQPLANLTRLEIHGTLYSDPAWIFKPFHLYPNLQTWCFLHWGSSCALHVDLSRLVTENCPKLERIEYRNAIHGRKSTVVSDVVSWTQASTRLLHFDSRAPSFLKPIYEALLCHADWIETLCLTFISDGEWNARTPAGSLDNAPASEHWSWSTPTMIPKWCDSFGWKSRGYLSSN
ncbi:hypothetical protein BG005_000729 [Podila minutissima]|nr:hypothetical protein BG005_000729 [Podila minutissima]